VLSLNAENSESITEQQRAKLKEKLGEIDKKLLTMEWDKEHNQLNMGMEGRYVELKAEHDKIVEQIKS
jgi:hypothetical protein